jgi:hypothetical protein
MAEAPSPGHFPPPYAGPSVWIRTIDSRGTILILFEFVEPGGYSVREEHDRIGMQNVLLKNILRSCGLPGELASWHILKYPGP